MARVTTQAFYEDIWEAIAKHGERMSNAEAVGALVIAALDLYTSAQDDEDDEDRERGIG